MSDRRAVTEAGLRRDLIRLGVEPGTILVVHSSLSSLGWVQGGAPSVVRALLGALGEAGTLAMPAATPRVGDPGAPVFDPETTPTTMGAIPETFRTWPGTRRSHHPLESVCARGPRAVEITAEHPLAFSEGPGTPFGRLHDLGARVLLLGVGFNRCTALHYAETLVAKRRLTRVRFPALDDGRRVRVEVPNVADDNDTHFPAIGEAYLAAESARRGRVGEAPATLFPMRDLVTFAVGYFERVL